MRIELQLTPKVAEELREARPQRSELRGLEMDAARDPVSELLQAIESLGLHLQPTHPGPVHPILAPFYFLEVPDRAAAGQVLERLRGLQAVEGAYIDPGIDLPRPV